MRTQLWSLVTTALCVALATACGLQKVDAVSHRSSGSEPQAQDVATPEAPIVDDAAGVQARDEGAKQIDPQVASSQAPAEGVGPAQKETPADFSLNALQYGRPTGCLVVLDTNLPGNLSVPCVWGPTPNMFFDPEPFANFEGERCVQRAAEWNGACGGPGFSATYFGFHSPDLWWMQLLSYQIAGYPVAGVYSRPTGYVYYLGH